jgi:hypothetical protein
LDDVSDWRGRNGNVEDFRKVRYFFKVVVLRRHLPPSAPSAISKASDDLELTDEFLRSLIEGKLRLPTPILSTCAPIFKALPEHVTCQDENTPTALSSSHSFPFLGVIATTCAAEISLSHDAIHVYVNSNATGTGTPFSKQTQSTL